MSNIFKIVHIKNNKIDKVYVFKGKGKKEDCFNNEEENKYKNAKIEYIDDLIFDDDSILQIKYKLINSMKEKHSTNELYLFANFMKYVDLNVVYENYTQDDKITISHDKIVNWLKNIQKSKLSYTHKHNYFVNYSKNEMAEYTYDELFKNLDLDF